MFLNEILRDMKAVRTETANSSAVIDDSYSGEWGTRPRSKGFGSYPPDPHNIGVPNNSHHITVALPRSLTGGDIELPLPGAAVIPS